MLNVLRVVVKIGVQPQFVYELQGCEVTADSLISILVDMGLKLYVSLEKDDFQELVEYHRQELSNEDLIELESQRVEDEIAEE